MAVAVLMVVVVAILGSVSLETKLQKWHRRRLGQPISTRLIDVVSLRLRIRAYVKCESVLELFKKCREKFTKFSHKWHPGRVPKTLMRACRQLEQTDENEVAVLFT